MQLPANRIIALVGANGAGKSTLMSIISGLLPATYSSLLVNGQAVVKGKASGNGGTADAGSRVAILAQDKLLYRDFTVADMLRFGRSTNRVWDQQRALSWLDTRGQNKLTVTQAQAVIAAAILRQLLITTGQRWDPVIATHGTKHPAVLPIAA